MLNALVWIIVIGLLTAFWLNSARAREMATEIARTLCQRRGLQFLDETVSLQRMGIRWTANGLRLRRMFRFDFSVEGMGRRTGWLILLGTDVEQLELGLPRQSQTIDGEAEVEASASESTSGREDQDSKVVPFERPKKH